MQPQFTNCSVAIYCNQVLRESNGCAWDGCDVVNPMQLEFDHLRDKTVAVTKCSTIDKARVEIEKCRILCTFHHRIISADQHAERQVDNPNPIQQRNKANRLAKKAHVNARKLSIGVCARCPMRLDGSDERAFSAFYFVYRDRTYTKGRLPVAAMAMRAHSITNINAAIADCDMLCANCFALQKNLVSSKTPEQLAEYAAAATNMTDFAISIGYSCKGGQPSSYVRQRLLLIMEDHQLDIEHFKTKNRIELFTLNRIRGIVEDSTSFTELSNKLGYKRLTPALEKMLIRELNLRSVNFDHFIGAAKRRKIK